MTHTSTHVAGHLAQTGIHHHMAQWLYAILKRAYAAYNSDA